MYVCVCLHVQYYIDSETCLEKINKKQQPNSPMNVSTSSLKCLYTSVSSNTHTPTHALAHAESDLEKQNLHWLRDIYYKCLIHLGDLGEHITHTELFSCNPHFQVLPLLKVSNFSMQRLRF